MAIKNPDGSAYTFTGSYQQYGTQNLAQLKLLDFWDQQVIMQGGSPLFYYEVFIPTAVIDKTYMEARSKLYSPNQIQIWGMYEPIASQNFITAFGWDSPDDIVFDTNAKSIIQTIGHMPKIGSRIHSPHLSENWEIVQRNLGDFKMWGAFRLQIICKRFSESKTTSEGRVTQNNP
jgi:hypothetical protein